MSPRASEDAFTSMRNDSPFPCFCAPRLVSAPTRVGARLLAPCAVLRIRVVFSRAGRIGFRFSENRLTSYGRDFTHPRFPLVAPGILDGTLAKTDLLDMGASYRGHGFLLDSATRNQDRFFKSGIAH